MSETQKYLPESTQQEKPKSQNGGSTNLSEGSNQVDQEFKVKKGQNFEFINEQTNDWPQWSIDDAPKKQEPVKDQKQQELQQLEKLQQAIELNNDYRFMYSRGMSLPVRIKLFQSMQKKKKEKQAAENKSFMSGVVSKIKGWFK